jgi:formate dehydrogenase beta subunit
VHMVCLEDWSEMPAAKVEIDEALEERIHIHTRKGPSRIVGENGKVTGFETIDCTSVFDEQHRFKPKFAPGTEHIIEADTVIMAIGQTSELTWVSASDGNEVTPRNTIKVDPATLATTAPGIFAGGDVSFGPRNAIDAVANGKKAAQSIHAFLSGVKGTNVEVALHDRNVEIIVSNTKEYKRKWGYEQESRVAIPVLPIERRIGVAQIELGYSEEEAQREASRCLHCWENTVFNEGGEETGSECILCGGCVDICPESCIELAVLDRLSGDEAQLSEVGATYDIIINGQSEEVTGSIMIKDEDRCIRCGLCAMRCPVACITMQGYTVSNTMSI